MPLRYSFARRLIRTLTTRLRPVTLPGVQLELTDGLRVHWPVSVSSDAALLWIHGGGLVIGSAAVDDRFCAETARDLGIIVVAAEYRLAPEHPYPAALDDCHAAWIWLQEHAMSLGIDPAKVIVGGQSAGGGIAAALTQRLAQSGGHQPVAQWLFCPMLDDRTAARRELDALGHRVWDNRLNRFGWQSYLATNPGAPGVPSLAAPARCTDLGGLPSAWIGVGDMDLFHDEDLAYAEALQTAGIETTVHVVPGAPHGFESWAADTSIARDYLAAARHWLSLQL